MSSLKSIIGNLRTMSCTLLANLLDAYRFLVLCLWPAPALAAEILFLRKQLALYEERQTKPGRANDATRMALVCLQALIRRMALENPTWGQERIANELLLKLGLQVSPRTVRKYMPSHCVGGPGKRGQSQRWSTFIRNHAKGIIACDFCVSVTATFRILYVFVIIEHASRRLIHINVTAHPTAQWTLQQFREAIPADHTYRMLIHDRDSIFSAQVDRGVRHMGLRVIKTPVRTPVANSICERVIGTLRRECLDCVMPLNERHLYGILKE